MRTLRTEYEWSARCSDLRTGRQLIIFSLHECSDEITPCRFSFSSLASSLMIKFIWTKAWPNKHSRINTITERKHSSYGENDDQKQDQNYNQDANATA